MGEDSVLHLLPDLCSLNLATTAVPVGCSSKRYHSRHPRSSALPKLTIVNVEVKEYLVICQILQSQSERILAGEGMSQSDVQSRSWERNQQSKSQAAQCGTYLWASGQSGEGLQGGLPSSTGAIPFSVALKTQGNPFLAVKKTYYYFYLV